jgi:hypothetical protein
MTDPAGAQVGPSLGVAARRLAPAALRPVGAGPTETVQSRLPGSLRATEARAPIGDFATILALFLASRAFLIGIGWLALRFVSSPFAGQSLMPDLFVRWDSFWYLNLVDTGYSTAESLAQTGATNFAFYPTYPALIWLVSRFSGLSPAAAGVAISNFAFLGALFVIYILGRHFTGRRIDALIAVALICFVPEGFVFSAVYTESLFVLVTAASMLAYTRGNYLTATLLSALGSSIRSNGAFIALWYGLEILRKRGFRGALRLWDRPEEYLPAAAAPIGLVVFWWLCYFYSGDAFAQKSTAVFGWGWLPAWPWNGIWAAIQHGTFNERFWVGSALVAIAMSLALLRQGHWPLFLYCAANFALYLSTSLPNSLLRYSIAIFPIYFGVAPYVRGPRALAVILIFLALGGALMAGWALGATISI